MLPIQLTIEGIYSYQERQTIDFKRLTDSQLFGIFGHVGSGKSTILEAISLALYGVSERLGKNDSPNYNLMNLRSTGLFIDFEFEAGAERACYRFIVKSKRQHKDFDKVKSLDRQQYKWENNEWIPLQANDAEPILGLSYQYFKRTIIIPQGRFQEFLQLNDKDRTQMMQDLFDLHRFDLQDNVKILKSSTNENLQHVEGELVRYRELSPESLVSQWEDLHVLQSDLAELKLTYEEVKRHYQQLEQVKQLNDRYQEAQNKFNELAQKKASFDKLAETIRQVRNCRYSFKDRLERIQKLEQSLEAHNNDLSQGQEKLQKEENQYNQYQNQLNKLKARFTDQSTFKDYLRDLQTIIDIRTYEQQLTEQSEERDQAQTELTQVKEAFDEQEAQWQKIQGQLQEYYQKMPDHGKLTALKSWFNQQRHYQDQKVRAQQEINDKLAAIDDMKSQYQQLIQNYQLASLNADFPSYTVKTLRQALHELKEQYNTQQDKLEQQILKLQRQEALEQHASHLNEGEPCPVCGAYEHPNPLKVGDTQSQVKAKTYERDQLKSWVRTIDQALQALEGLKQQYQELSKEQKRQETQLSETERQLENHEQGFVWEDYRGMTEADIDKALQEAEGYQAEMQSMEQKRNEAEKYREEARNKIQKVDEKRQQHQQEVNLLSDRIANHKNQLQYLKVGDYQAYDENRLKETLETWNNWYQEMQELAQTLEQLEETIHNQRQQVDQIQTQIKEQQRSKSELQEEVDHLLSQSEFTSIGEVQAILDKHQNLDVDAEEERLNEFSRQYEAQKGVLNELQAKMDKAKQYDEQAFQAAKEKMEETQGILESAGQAVAVQKEALNRLQTALKEKREKEVQQESLKNRLNNLEVLEKLFRGRGFVRYISAVFLGELVRAANERFRHLTHNQLQLEVTGNAELQIRDLLNDGRLRSVKTLSGGQTFQVSLSLALALAERIQQLTKSPQNFFFLDEGFGSLDRSSLNLVFDTLYRLRKENRIVGLISHVETLKEGLETSLTVENHPQRGSLISHSI